LGKNPEEFGCGNGAQTVFNEQISEGSYKDLLIEVRYSETCKVAWARMSGSAKVGDVVEIEGGGVQQRDAVLENNNKFTPMLPVSSGLRVRVCVAKKDAPRRCAQEVAVGSQ
jgi:Protein of unknown function (DUF2690)